MSKKLKKLSVSETGIASSIMSQIRQGKLKMHPKIYFVMGSLLTFFGLVFSIFTAVFLTSLFCFSWRTASPMIGHRIDRMFLIFPWWLFVLAILSLVLGIWLIRRYSFSYKISFKIIIIGLIISIIIIGWLIDIIGLNNILFRQRPMQGMRRYFQERSIRSCSSWGGCRQHSPGLRNNQ